MELDDEVCLCFHVTQRKILSYVRIERPQRASQLAQCYGAGTGCGWCRPFLERLYLQARRAAKGTDSADGQIVSAEQYACRRARYIEAGHGTPPTGSAPQQPPS